MYLAYMEASKPNSKESKIDNRGLGKSGTCDKEKYQGGGGGWTERNRSGSYECVL